MRKPSIEKPIMNGIQKVYIFPNGYGASVIRHRGSYGNKDGLWELAVLLIENHDPLEWDITYDTPITDDVLGYLEEKQVEEILNEIEKLEVTTE